MEQKLLDKITELLSKEAENEGIEFISAKFKSDKLLGDVLEVLIDKNYQITLDEISSFTEKANAILDGIPELNDSYILDVSSGGSERAIPFADLSKLLDHYLDLVLTDGEKITAKLVALNEDEAEFVYFIKGRKKKLNLNSKDIKTIHMGYKA